MIGLGGFDSVQWGGIKTEVVGLGLGVGFGMALITVKNNWGRFGRVWDFFNQIILLLNKNINSINCFLCHDLKEILWVPNFLLYLSNMLSMMGVKELRFCT